jgi:signal peptidase I
MKSKAKAKTAREATGKKAQNREGKAGKHYPMWPFYLLLFLLIVVYAVHNSFDIGIIIFALIILILVLEARVSVAVEGKKKSIVDIGIALGIAIAFWIILVIVLQTSSPIDAVASCSMLPALHRGDLVVLHGIVNPVEFADEHHIPMVNVSSSEFNYMESNMNNEFLAYYAYLNNNKSEITDIIPKGVEYSIGLYNTECVNTYSYEHKNYNLYKCYMQNSTQSNNLIKYTYAMGKDSVNGVNYSAVYTSGIRIGNVSLTQNFSNPIIVYRTTSRDYFSGDIIHRLYAIVNASGSYYFLTMGDNNPGLDIEFANYPANESSVIGYVIADIPIVGYLKLIISGQFGSVAGCNEVMSR